MEAVCGLNRESHIAGCCVHNTWIERLWRDIYTTVSSTYVIIFDDMEAQHILHADNNTELLFACIIYVSRSEKTNHFVQISEIEILLPV